MDKIGEVNMKRFIFSYNCNYVEFISYVEFNYSVNKIACYRFLKLSSSIVGQHKYKMSKLFNKTKTEITRLESILIIFSKRILFIYPELWVSELILSKLYFIARAESVDSKIFHVNYQKVFPLTWI